jgi:hypothetical protein
MKILAGDIYSYTVCMCSKWNSNDIGKIECSWNYDLHTAPFNTIENVTSCQVVFRTLRMYKEKKQYWQ